MVVIRPVRLDSRLIILVNMFHFLVYGSQIKGINFGSTREILLADVAQSNQLQPFWSTEIFLEQTF